MSELVRMADKLVEIASENWPALRDLYDVTDPNTYYGHCTVENYIQWLKKEPLDKDYSVYSLNGEWSDGTYLIVNRSYVFVSTLATTSERLARLVQLLDFTKRYKFICIMSKDYPEILNALKRQNVNIDMDVEFLLFSMPRENALELDPIPPEGITLKPLRECDAETLEELRPDLSNESSDFNKQLIRLNPTVGAYTADDKLVAWFKRFPDGQAGALQVRKEYYGRGLGKTVAKHLLRQIAELGYMNVITILEENKYSRNIFEPMGFQLVGRVRRVYTLPNKK